MNLEVPLKYLVDWQSNFTLFDNIDCGLLLVSKAMMISTTTIGHVFADSGNKFAVQLR